MNELLNFLKNNKVEKIIIGDSINININNDFETIKIDDVRSAAFYAFGESKILNKNIILIIDGHYLPNVYTVLTEAWFQKTNLTIISLFDSIYDVETNYLNRCSVANIKILEKDIQNFKEKIDNILSKIGPKVINIILENKNETKKINYNNEIKELKKYLNNTDEIICYNSLSIPEIQNFKNIEPKYKYGIISKYCANITEITNQSILLCDTSCVKIDSNIFNNRYLNNKFKVIIKNNDKSFNIKTWAESNNIKYIECKEIKENIKNLYYSEEPTILIIEGGN